MNIGLIIDHLRRGKTFEAFASDLKSKVGLELHPTTLQKYTKAGTKSGRYPSYPVLKSLAEYAQKEELNIPELYALLGNNETVQDVATKYEAINKEIDKLSLEVVQIPIIGKVPAGGPILAEENFEGMMPLPHKFVRGPENVFCLRVTGDSMQDVDITDGDYVLVRQQQVAETGQTVIARINGEVTCKRFYKLDDKIRLEPANSKYKALESQDVEIVGVVFKVIKDIF